MSEALPLFFVSAMGLSLLLYVILDGFDLGVGMLLPFGTDVEKDTMIASIGPFWDANETWIVQGLVSTTEVVAQHPSATLAGTLFGYVGLYIALMIAYMKALRIMAVKPAKSLEEDSNPLGTPLVGTTA